MPNSADFRFSGSVIFLLTLTLISFLIRRKWRIAAQRREEVKKLLVLASEEAARAEFEASVQYSSMLVATKQHCVVCFCPTTTRCARCKAVRYCSGKCQIIHWRQGHKEECHPPTTTVEFNPTEGRDPDLKPVLQKTNLNSCDENLEIEGKYQAATIEKSLGKPKYSEPSCFSVVGNGKDDIEAKPCEDTTKTDRIVTDSSSVSSSAGSTEHRAPISGTSAGSSSPLCVDVAPDFLTKAADVDEPVPMKLQPSGTLSLNKLTVETFSDCSTTSFPGSGFNSSRNGSDSSDQSDSGSVSSLSSDLSGQAVPVMLSHSLSNPRKGTLDNGAAPPKNFFTTASLSTDSPVLGSGRSISTANNASTDVDPPKYRQRSSSWVSSVDIASSKKSAASALSPKVDSVDPIPTCSSEAPSSALNGNGLKTSMRKVVQQFRGSKPSKHSPLGCGNDITGKSSKMLFPYDLFVKLYNWDKVELRPYGLINCGNSCYANAVLQCLSFTRPLTAYLLQGLHTKSCPKKDWCFTCEFESLVLQARETKNPLSPIRILSQIQSIGSNLGYGREEDAHEFLRYAIDTMQSVCVNEAIANSVGPIVEETTLIHQVFGGYLRSNIKCLRCQGKSERHERMMDLTVEIQGNIGTLEEALAQFTATEILDGDNKYQCDRCKSYEKAKKKLTVYEAPNILTIALKRFQSGKFGKLNKFVRFPEILNLAPYMSGIGEKSHMYRLYAVVVHLDVMNASFSGHYVCYVKNFQGKWNKIDDSKVKPVELERVLSKGAYMLLYARCSPRPPSWIRNGVFNDHGKTGKNRYMETVSSHFGKNSIPKTRSGTTFSNGTTLSGLRMPDEHRMARTGVTNSEAFEYFDERFLPANRLSKIDTFSDSSSLFSCSDEGSCSTESTRDSTSTDEYSEYIFGDSGPVSWNSPIRLSEDCDVSSPSMLSRSSPLAVSSGFNPGSPDKGLLNFSFTYQKSIHDAVSVGTDGIQVRVPAYGGRGDSQAEGNPGFFYPDPTTNQSRKKSMDCCSSSETDSDLLGWVHPYEKSDVALRKSCRERTQPFS